MATTNTHGKKPTKAPDRRALRERSPSPEARVDGTRRTMMPLSAAPTSSSSSRHRGHGHPPEEGASRAEGTHRAHHYTEEEWKKITTFSSITYLPLHTRIYKKWLQQNWVAREWDHWVMMGLIGFFVGLLGATLKITIEKISESKYEHINALLGEGRFGLMWFVAILISMSLALASAVVVVYGEPAAGGSGIPDVMAYLNGVSIRKIFGAKALLVKFFSCIFAVSAGLYGGQEGPMIHMGAAMGKIMSQGFSSKVSRWMPNFILFRRFRNMYDRRNFISAGAAAGVASAFTAPVGGLLFVLEEISSFWTHKLAWQTFFCCGVSTFTTQAFTSLYRTGTLGSFSSAVFNIEQAINSQLTMFLPTVGVGVIGGLFAALFTWANLKICKWRNRNIVPKPWARITEPVVMAFITTTLAVLIPYLFECMPSRCNQDATLPGCTARYASSAVEEMYLVQYTCKAEGMYNPAASLFFTTGDKTIEHLLSRNTHYMYDYGSLVTLLVVYFSLCCYTAGMAPALGTMVPALLIGSVLGRIAGLGVTDLVGIRNSEAWTWVDPGGFALIGAAAFFGGLTRLTFSLAVVMIEITDETHFLLPIMTAVMVGKWTADSLIDSLYHNLIELKCFPFLSDQPHVEECLDLHAVEDVMARDVVTIPEIGTVAAMAQVLASCKHRAFPVVEATSSGAEVFKVSKAWCMFWGGGGCLFPCGPPHTYSIRLLRSHPPQPGHHPAQPRLFHPGQGDLVHGRRQPGSGDQDAVPGLCRGRGRGDQRPNGGH